MRSKRPKPIFTRHSDGKVREIFDLIFLLDDGGCYTYAIYRKVQNLASEWAFNF